MVDLVFGCDGRRRFVVFVCLVDRLLLKTYDPRNTRNTRNIAEVKS
jgi:hypothetical protein